VLNSSRGGVRVVMVVVMLCAGARGASGATWYVADVGVDGPACGLTASAACRSIGQAIELATAGDTIIVGPGRYGDLNGNQVLGETGEERGSDSGACVLAVNKAVIIVSSGGAAATVIDGHTADAEANVCVTAAGAQFGRPAKGFTVTESAHYKPDFGGFDGVGIRLDGSGGVTVRGNRVTIILHDRVGSGVGILAVNDAPHLIEGNSPTRWGTGIDALGPTTTVRKNEVTESGIGINGGGAIVGNLVMFNFHGIVAWPTANVTSNAAWMNEFGILVGASFAGVITKNNLFVNTTCGLSNIGRAGLKATNNYWGAPSGPGSLPASPVCDQAGGTTVVSPVAAKPFTVTILKP
jgi:hypothetical protein